SGMMVDIVEQTNAAPLGLFFLVKMQFVLRMLAFLFFSLTVILSTTIFLLFLRLDSVTVVHLFVFNSLASKH
ncbi:MAG: hypothetical protein K8S14_09845, partial [Actinomycetia bacterium]|nr:hypothetical protein [Actinomycetes bacterium]